MQSTSPHQRHLRPGGRPVRSMQSRRWLATLARHWAQRLVLRSMHCRPRNRVACRATSRRRPLPTRARSQAKPPTHVPSWSLTSFLTARGKSASRSLGLSLAINRTGLQQLRLDHHRQAGWVFDWTFRIRTTLSTRAHRKRHKMSDNRGRRSFGEEKLGSMTEMNHLPFHAHQWLRKEECQQTIHHSPSHRPRRRRLESGASSLNAMLRRKARQGPVQ